MSLRKPLTRFAAGVLGGILAGLLALPLMVAHAQEERATDVEPSDATWWYWARDPIARTPVPYEEIPDPTGARDIPRTEVRNRSNPYPGEFLRAGANPAATGAEAEIEAMFGIQFPLFELGDGLDPTITGGTVTFVQAPGRAPNEDDVNAGANGQRGEAIADMAACLALEPFFGFELGGNWEDRPEHDPEVCSPLELQEDVEPNTWIVDLAPFASTWADPLQNFGIIVVPNPGSPAQGAWHVAFDSPQNPRADATPPKADLTYIPPEDPGAFPDDDLDDDLDDVDEQAFDPGGFDDGGFDGGFTPAPSGGLDTFTAPSPGFDNDVAVADPDVAEAPEFEDFEEEVVEQPLFAGEPTGDIRTNPAVYLLPFVGLGLLTLIGYSLTQDPVLPAVREGAVSKLMRRRANGG